MSAKHTPGPWFRPRVQTIRSVHTNRLIARIDAGGDISGGEVVANARLIAAAPEVTDAAETALAFLGGYLNEHGGSDCASQAYVNLRDAIHKARGQS